MIGATRDIAGNAVTLEDVQRIEKKGRWRAWYERQTPERQREVGRRARKAGRIRDGR